MGDETTALDFDAILAFAPDNARVFGEMCAHTEKLVPFVGAGLSAFVYPCWRDFLVNTAKPLPRAQRSEIASLAGQGRCEDAAGLLEARLGDASFRAAVAQAFGEGRLFAPGFEDAAEKEAVCLLPGLFRSLVLTTNFDCLLERIYRLRGTPFRTVGHPGAPEALAQGLAGGSCLFKFHGDVKAPERLVLTRERYDFCYRQGGALIPALTACFSQKHVLFLGCSLTRDRTTQVLARMLGHGAHYAVLGCKQGAAEQKAARLRAAGIRALFYPAGEYNAVRMILDRLQRETKAL